MEYSLFQKNVISANRIIKYLVFSVITLLLSIFILSILCIFLSHQKTTVLLPMNVDSPIMVSNNSIDSHYLTESAISFIALRLNFDPESIANNEESILRFVNSNHYADIKANLDQEKALIKKQSISSNFYINDIRINRETLSVLVSGTLLRFLSDRKLSPIQTGFQINFKNNNGLLSVTDFFEVKPS